MNIGPTVAVVAALTLAACGGGSDDVASPVEDLPEPPGIDPEPPPDSTPDPEPDPVEEVVTPPPPPAPMNVSAAVGIGVAMLSWDNPFQQYAGHGVAYVYRSTVNDFATATQIGTAEWLLYTDETVTGGETYYYWIRFVSESGALGPISQVASAMPARDPAAEIDRVSDSIWNDPATYDLLLPIGERASFSNPRQRLGDMGRPRDSSRPEWSSRHGRRPTSGRLLERDGRHRLNEPDRRAR